jgi:phage virion morphogenesis protein
MIEKKITLQASRFKAAIAKQIEKNADFTPLMREVKGFLADRVEENFAEEGRPQWAPLSPVTVRRRGSAHPILQVSGSLAASVVAESDASSATVGSNKVYARVQQEGAAKGAFGKGKTRAFDIPWGNIPARPFLAVTQDDEQRLVAIAIDYQKDAENSGA